MALLWNNNWHSAVRHKGRIAVEHTKTWHQQLKPYNLWLKPAKFKPQTPSTGVFSSRRNYTTLCSTSFPITGRLVIARSAYCCLCLIVPECSCFVCPKAVQHRRKGIPGARSRPSMETTIMILFLHNLVVSQIAISLMQGFLSRRGFRNCHMLVSRYVYMHVYVHVSYWNVSYQNVPYRRLCTWNIRVSILFQNCVPWHYYSEWSNQ